MDKNSINNTVVVLKDKVKEVNSMLPAGLLVGAVAGFFIKGIKGAVIGAIGMAALVKVYENYKNAKK